MNSNLQKIPNHIYNTEQLVSFLRTLPFVRKVKVHQLKVDTMLLVDVYVTTKWWYTLISGNRKIEQWIETFVNERTYLELYSVKKTMAARKNPYKVFHSITVI